MTGHFSRYVGGLAGIGLLVLRTTVGVMAIAQGCALAPGHESGLSRLWLFVAVMCLGGTALILGVLTVLTGLTIGLAETGAACSLLSSPPLVSPHFQAAPVLVIVMTIVVILIGPGAFSVDARLFGLREVRIPPIPPPSEF